LWQVAETRAQLAEMAAALTVLDSKPHRAEITKMGEIGNDEKLTIKEMVVEVLGVLGRGADALEILRLINERFQADLERTSLSPQLSRLKTDGILDRQGMIWILKQKGPAEAGPSLFPGVAGSPHGRPTQAPAVGSIPTTSNPSLSNGSA